MWKEIEWYNTGSHRGYIRAADRKKWGDVCPIPDTLKGIRGNKRKALEWFKALGCTHWTKSSNNAYANSSQYAYDTYHGLIWEEG